AAEGIEFHRPLESSRALEEVHARIRRASPRFDKDRFFAPSIDAARSLVQARAFKSAVTGLELPSGN
ncbi:MAG TPA: hypothetical protein VH000_00400, partial [Rhizomicrobium sp.]|nr:hypothetical protein [Rhizomicrobium sp.]